MPLISLDHTQRLNLHVLLGAQRVDIGQIRAIWRLQDRIALDAGEEQAIELKREFVAGQERTIWNPAATLPAREFEFDESELARIRAALDTWHNYGAATDRRWLEPLLDAIGGAL